VGFGARSIVDGSLVLHPAAIALAVRFSYDARVARLTRRIGKRRLAGERVAVDRADIVAVLRALSADLEAQGIRGELFLVGGEAMALAYSTRRATADLDAIFEPKAVVYEAAARVGQQFDLAAGWLNDAVKGFLPGSDPNATVFLDEPGLRVMIASPRYLLAMKLMASRVERDEDDIRTLLRICNITAVGDALDLIEGFYGEKPIEPTVQYLVAELLT
jgi:Nucleotidyltransferase of unknown function (DUF6036)